MKKEKSKIIRYLAMLGLSLIAVSVTAISTAAWFQINSVTYSGGQTVNAGSANLTVGDVYGYKAVRQPDETGTLTVNEDSVTKKKVGGAESTTNTGSAEEDTDLNVPAQGEGYYIVKRHNGKFLYDGYSTKLEGYTYSGQYTLDSFSFEAGAVYRFMHYSNNGQTVNAKVSVTSVTGGGASVSSGDLSMSSSTITRKLWFNANTGAVGLENTATSDYKTKNARIGGRKNATHSYGILNEDNYKRIYLTRNWNWNELRVHYWGAGDVYQSMTKVFTNDQSQDVYMAFIPAGATGFQFDGKDAGNNNAYKVSHDCSMPSGDYVAYYFDSWDGGNNKANVSTWSYSETYYTYYFNNLDKFTTPRAHVWMNTSSTNSSNANEIVLGTMYNAMENMTQVSSTPRYSVSVPYWSGLYTHIIFYQDSSNKTANLTNVSGNNGKTFEISSGQSGDAQTGTWRGNPSGTTHQYYLVDFGARLNSGNTLPKVQVWDNTGTVYTPTGSAGYAMTQPTTNVRIFQTPALDDSYDRIKFLSNNGSNSTLAAGKAFSNSNAGQYFEIDDGSGTSCDGRWTIGPARTVKNAEAYTKTIYLYDPTNALQGATPKCYAWDGDSSDGYYYTPANQIWPGVTSDSTITGTYYNSTSKTATIYSWTISGDYTKVIFNNGSRDGDNQTGVLNISDGQVFELNTRSAGNNLTGVWRDLPSDTDNTYYLYDLGAFGSAPYAYAWKDNGSVAAFPPIYGKADVVGSRATIAGYTRYAYSIPDNYDSILFSNGTESKKTGTITLTGKNNKVFVITSAGTGSHTGKWYNTVSALSGSTYTVRIYDRHDYFSDAPYIYARYENHYNDATDTSGTTFYYPYENASRPGQAMTGIAGVTDGFEKTIPVEYDKVTFYNSGQTVYTAEQSFSNSNPYFITQSKAGATVSGTWSSGLKYVIQKTSYFLYDGTNYRRLTDSKFDPQEIVTTEGIGTATFAPSDYTSADYIGDAYNGVYYKFLPEADNWYNEVGCSTTFSTSASPSGTLTSEGTIIYKKMICDTRDMTTIYIDVSGDNWAVWNGVNVYAWESADSDINNGNGNDKYSNFSLGDGAKIAANLYQLTLPDSMNFRLNGTGSSGGSNESENVTSASSHEGEILYLRKHESYGYNRYARDWGAKRNDFIGTATIKVTSGSTTTPYTMGIGDINHNYFLFERGIDMMAGDYFVIEVSDPKTDKAANLSNAHVKDLVSDPNVYTFNDQDLSTGVHGTAAPYIVHSGDSTYAYDNTKIRVKTSGRYTVYLTSSGDIQLVSVPVLGNGYYIMPYDDTTDGYIGAAKMTSVIDNGEYTGAYYNAYKVTPTMKYNEEEDDANNAAQIYVRSYVNAVDKLRSENLVTERGVTATIDDGVITIMAGTYNIRVSGDTVYISSIAIDDFFAMDPLLSGKSIKDNYTSIVYEIEFTTENDLPIKAAAEAQSMPSYLGFAIYASASPITTWNDKVNEDAPYLYMRANYLSSLVANNSEAISSASLPANDGNTTYYAYIIIDYRGTPPLTIKSHDVSNISFYLKCIQA